MKTILFSLITCFAITAAAQTRDSIYVQFPNDDYWFTRNAIWEIDNFIKPYPPKAVIDITLSGHTDSTGSNQYNLALSIKRAETVLKYLAEKKYNASLISTSVHGFHEPLVAETDDYNKHQNRRVKIVFELDDLVLKSLNEAVSLWDLEFEDVSADNQTDTVHVNNANPSVSIDPKNNNHIISDNTGLGVTIKRDALSCEVFPVVTVSSFNTVADVVSTGMYTISEGKPLESGGFFKITATINNQEVEIADGMDITITIPAEKYDPEMRIFTANTNANGMNWMLRQYGKSSYDQNLRYDETLKAYIVTVNSTGWINLDKYLKEDYYTLKVKSGRLINRNNQLIAASKDRVTAVNMVRKRRKYMTTMARY